MIAPTQIQRPTNWQDFESLCKKLWGEIWECPNSIKKNGRSGQAQHGVDVYGIPKGETMYYGIQCKYKEDYTKSQLTQKEIDTEIEKAKTFKPALKVLIFATSANKDAKIEEYIRVKHAQHMQENLFGIEIFSWEDIVDLISENKVTKDWYVYNILYKEKSDIAITFNGKSTETINPTYIRETIKYFPKDLAEKLFNANSPWSQFNKISELAKKVLIDQSIYRTSITKYRKNFTWCKVYVEINNTGDTTIDDYKLYLTFDTKSTEDICDCSSFINNPLIHERIHINNQRLNSQEVFVSKSECNTIEIIPQKNTLVSSEKKQYAIKIKPVQGANNINVKWKLISRNFQKTGILNINVVPIYEDKNTTVYVDNIDALMKDEIKIYPKIIEE